MMKSPEINFQQSFIEEKSLEFKRFIFVFDVGYVGDCYVGQKVKI